MNDSDISYTNTGNVVLSGDLTIFTIADSKTYMMDTLNAHEEIRMVFKDITAVDLTGLQMLCSVHRTAAAMGKKLCLLEPLPEQLRQAAWSAGFGRRTGCSFSPKTDCLFWDGGE